MSETTIHRLTTTAWILLGAACCSWMLPLEPNLLEEGIALHLAQRMVQGEHLFRDLASFTGPLPFEWLALLFRLFGDDIFVARGAVAVFHGLACGALYALARSARADGQAHLAAAFLAAAPVLLFPLFSLYYYGLIAIQLAIAAAWATHRGVESSRFALLAGALVASVALCKQNLGAGLSVAMWVPLAALVPRPDRVRRSLAYAAGGGAVAVVTLVAYALRGDVGPLFESLVTLPLSFSETFDSPYMNMWPPGEFREDIFIDRGRYVPALYGFLYSIFEGISATTALSTQLLYASPFIALALTAWQAVRGPLPAATWVHLALLVALIPNLFPRTDWGHLVYVLPAAVVQLCLIARPLPEAGRQRASIVALAGGLGVVVLSIGSWLYVRSEPARFGPALPIRPVNVMLRGPVLPRVIHAIRNRVAPGEPIFVARSEPLVYYATSTSNPTPYSGVIPGIRERQERTIVEGLEQVRYAVMSDIDQPLFLYYSDELPAVWSYLERYFRVARGAPEGWLTLLERANDRGPTAVDLFDLRQSGRAFVRRGDGFAGTPDAAPPRLAARLNRRPLSLWLGDRGGGIDFDVEIPGEAVFQMGIGLPRTIGLTSPYTHPRDVDIVVSLRTGDDPDARFRELERVTLPRDGSRPTGWTPLETSLDAWAGERVTLRLEVQSATTLGRHRLAWFGSPRIALRPER